MQYEVNCSYCGKLILRPKHLVLSKKKVKFECFDCLQIRVRGTTRYYKEKHKKRRYYERRNNKKMADRNDSHFNNRVYSYCYSCNEKCAVLWLTRYEDSYLGSSCYAGDVSLDYEHTKLAFIWMILAMFIASVSIALGIGMIVLLYFCVLANYATTKD